MTKKIRQAVSRAPKSGPGAKRGKRPAEKRTMLSIRLNERERALLTEAASLHEQSPTGFIKSAAISHAAHVVNTSKKTTFDFGALESAVARLLFTTEFDREYRARYLTDPNANPASFEVLTYKGHVEEINEFDGQMGSLGGGDLPERWLRIDTDLPICDFDAETEVDNYINGDAPIIRDNRVPMTKKGFLELRRAARLGGAEILQRILEVRAKVYFGDEDLDEPIDPQTID